jgi:hypothetical protein
MKLGRTLVVSAFVLLASSGAFAMFRAADLVVVPTAASTPGLSGSNWRTDLEIMNVDTTPIDVSIVLLQCCNPVDNATWYADIKNALGGRSADGFGHIDAKLADIQPGAAVQIGDVITANWGPNIKGALLVFAYEAGTLMTTTPPGGNPKLIVVNARTYSLGTDANGNPLTYGTQVPGLPWHDYIDPGLQAKGLNKAVFTGLREDANYRTAIGLINISDRLTNLDVQLTLNAADGTQLGQQFVTLYPLAQDQYDQAIINLFGKTLADAISGATLTVTVVSYTSGSQTPAPALMAYVTRMDNATNDPVYIEQTFTKGFPWDCIFNGNCTAAAASLAVPAVPRGTAPHLRPPTPAGRLAR